MTLEELLHPIIGKLLLIQVPLQSRYNQMWLFQPALLLLEDCGRRVHMVLVLLTPILVSSKMDKMTLLGVLLLVVVEESCRKENLNMEAQKVKCR